MVHRKREDYSKTSVEDSVKIFIERENIVSRFLVQGHQAAVGLLSQHCFHPSYSYFLTEPLQYLHKTLVLLLFMAGFIVLLLPKMRRSTVCLSQENTVLKHPSLKKATIQIHVQGLAES